MSAVIIPIASDPKKAQAIADSHGLILLADGRMVSAPTAPADLAWFAYTADIADMAAFVAQHLPSRPTPPSAA